MGGLGLITGPLIGSILFSIFGFKWTFFVYGGAEVLLAIVVKFYLTERIRANNENRTSDSDTENLIKT